MRYRPVVLLLCFLSFCHPGSAGRAVAETLVIEQPSGSVSFPDLQLFYEKNHFQYGTDFQSGWNIDVNACGTLDFQSGAGVTLNGSIVNQSTLRFVQSGAESVTLSNLSSPGSLWIEEGTLVRVASQDDLEISRLYGAGVLKVDGDCTVSQLISPSYWGRQTTQFLNDDGTPGETVVSAATTGSTFTLQTGKVTFGEDMIFAPYVFEDSASQASDRLTVSGTVRFEEGAYIQPMLSEALRSNPSAASSDKQVILKADALEFAGAQQQYAWGDMTSESFSGNYDNPDEICSPIVYRIDYDQTAGEISIQKEFTWCGNYMKLLQSGSESPEGSVRNLATIFNEMMCQGTTTDTTEAGVSTLYHLSDLGILRQVAQAGSAEEAARLMRQVTPELYFSQFSLVALNALQGADTALEQMSLGRQYHGLRSRLGRCADGDPKVSEKREHYDPFLAQFEGDRTWSAWVTPTGKWLERNPGSLVSQTLGYRYESYGVNAGIARNLGSVSLGLSVDWQDGSFSGKDTSFSSEMDSFQALLLGAWYCGNWWADGWFGYHHVSAATQRASLAWTDCSTRYGSSVYTVQGWSGGFNLGYQWDFPICSISPSAGFHFGTVRNHTLWDSASLTEISASNRGLYEVPLGLRFTHCFQASSAWVIVPMLKTEWIARFGDTGDEFVSTTYAYTGSTGSAKPDATGYYLYSRGDEIPSEFHTNAKLNAMRGHLLLGCEYDGSFAEDWTIHRVAGTLGMVW